MDYEEYLASLDGKDDDSSIEDAIAAIDKSIENIEDPVSDPDPNADPTPDLSPDPEDEPSTDPDPEDKPVVEEKPKQTPEENAKFADQRRQKQIDDRVAAELKRLQDESPEFKMAKTLSEIYGQPVDVIYQQLEEARLAKQAEQMKVPVEYLKEQEANKQETKSLREQLTQLQFEAWTARVEREETQMKAEYPMLTDEDIFDAKAYLLQRLGRDVPLDQAIHSLHGKKIIQSLKESTKNETLAEMSGRKKGALPPQGGKAAPSVSLSADELYIAKQMGMSPEEYHKYKIM